MFHLQAYDMLKISDLDLFRMDIKISDFGVKQAYILGVDGVIQLN